MKRISIAFSSMAIMVVVALSNHGYSSASDASQMEKPIAPSWELKDLDGNTVHYSDFKGKVVILDFWATWCPPCRAEIPDFIKLQRQYQARGLAIIGVSVDQAGPDAIKAFVHKMAINYPVVLADTNVVSAFGGIQGLPTTFVIDRAGRIVKQHLGFVEKEAIESEIKPLLNP